MTDSERTANTKNRAADVREKVVAGSRLDLRGLENTLAYRLRMAQEAAFHRYRGNLSEFSSLHPGHFSALSVIAANPGCNQTDLGLAIGRDKSTLTVLLKTLEREKFIVRKRRLDNQRTYSLSLTPQGQAVLRSLQSVAEEHEQAISNCFTPREKDAFMDYLQRIIDMKT